MHAMPSFSVRLVLNAAVLVCLCQLPAIASPLPPTALITPITLDSQSLNYMVKIGQRTPMQLLQLILDIEQDFTWVRCYNNTYVSSTYRPLDCSTQLCRSYDYSACFTCLGPLAPGCNNHSCSVPDPAESDLRGELGQDVAALLLRDGRKYSVFRLPFACTEGRDPADLLPEFDGVAAMSSSTLALPAQLSAKQSFSRKFGICLPRAFSDGYLSFGDIPLLFSPLKGGEDLTDLSGDLVRTPLIRNPIKMLYSTHASTHGYYIGVQGIKVNGVDVPIDAEKLRINTSGHGGTKLSTVVRYTQLANPIYNALAALYIKMAAQMKIKQVAFEVPYLPDGQTGVCFNASHTGEPPYFGSINPALNVPTIDFVLQGNGIDPTIWRMLGFNSMELFYNPNVVCLAFVPGGETPIASIVIGTHQMQENFAHFDLDNSTVGFSPNLFSLPQLTSCANFNMITSL